MVMMMVTDCRQMRAMRAVGRWTLRWKKADESTTNRLLGWPSTQGAPGGWPSERGAKKRTAGDLDRFSAALCTTGRIPAHHHIRDKADTFTNNSRHTRLRTRTRDNGRGGTTKTTKTTRNPFASPTHDYEQETRVNI
jgi:hypothetical protein